MRLRSDGMPVKNFDGKYESGTRKCSKCKAFKTKADFNKEEEKKPASKRICNACGAPLPGNLSVLTVVVLKKELSQRGLETTGKKADLVERLEAARAREEPKAPEA